MLTAVSANLKLFVAINDSTFGQVIWRKLKAHSVSRKNFDVVHPHLAGDVCQYFVPVFQLNTKSRVG